MAQPPFGVTVLTAGLRADPSERRVHTGTSPRETVWCTNTVSLTGSRLAKKTSLWACHQAISYITLTELGRSTLTVWDWSWAGVPDWIRNRKWAEHQHPLLSAESRKTVGAMWPGSFHSDCHDFSTVDRILYNWTAEHFFHYAFRHLVTAMRKAIEPSGEAQWKLDQGWQWPSSTGNKAEKGCYDRLHLQQEGRSLSSMAGRAGRAGRQGFAIV